MLRRKKAEDAQKSLNPPPWKFGRRITGFVYLVVAFCAMVACLAMQAQTTPVSNVEATTAPLASPAGIAYDASGNMYFADLNNHVVRKVSAAGIITTVAGTGEQGFAGDGGSATSAWLDSPVGVAVDRVGNLYISDSHNQRIRRVSGGTIATIAGTGVAGFSGDGGAAVLATLSHPTGLAVDTGGNLYVADTDNHRIRKISGTTITTVAGSGEQGFAGDGGPATAAWLDSPDGVAVDATGNLYIADTHNQRIRVVSAEGTISTIAGNGSRAYAGDGGSAVAASLARPRGLSVDALGNIYFADSDNNRIRLIATTGIITTVAGNGSQGDGGDGGSALDATLDTPRATAVRALGIFDLSDTHNDIIREVGLNGLIYTIAGISLVSGESLTLSGPASVVYGSGSLMSTFSNYGLTATGQVNLLDITSGSTVVGSATLSANTATLSSSTLSAGMHRLVLSYGGDGQNAAITSGVFVLTVDVLPITATANGVSVPFGQAIPTLTGTLTGVLPQDTGNVTAVFATTATSTSPFGSYPITVTLAGTSAANYKVTLTANSGNVIIGKTASTVTLTSSNIAPFFGSPVTFTGVVASSTTGTPTGTLSFLDGTTFLATVVISSTGSATYTSSALAVGTHSLTAVYSGDTNFAASTSPAVIESVTDFTLVINGTSTQTVNPGEVASYNFAVQSGGTPGAITFTASGLPPGAAATFTPATIPAGSLTTAVGLSIQTAGLQAVNRRSALPSQIPLLPLSAVFLLPLLGGRRIRASLARMPRTLLVVIAGMVMLGLSGCGSGGFFGNSPKTYTITVTASMTGATTLQHTATITLTVQ